MTYSASIRTRARKDGTAAFDVRYRLHGKSKTLSFETFSAAERWARIVRQIGPEQALTAVKERDTLGATPTVDEWADTYIRSLSGLEGLTTEHYRLYMRVSISPTLGELPLDAVTPQRIADWINSQSRKYAAKTVKNRHALLYAMFDTAVERGIIERNPCAKSRLPESEERERVFLSLDEYQTILRYLPEADRPLVQLAAATGMRWGEVSALKPADFDLKQKTVRVARAWKRSAERGWYISAPKTRRSRRTISLPDNLVPILRPLLAAGNEWVFTNRDGQPWRHAKFYEDHWKPAVRLANGQPAFTTTPRPGSPWAVKPAEDLIGKWPGLHSLRHSHVMWLMQDGVDPLTIQRRLGHESIQTTLNVYGHLSPDMLARPAAAMDRMLTGH